MAGCMYGKRVVSLYWTSVTLDSGRGKRRLKDVEGTRILEGLLQGTWSGGFHSKS